MVSIGYIRRTLDKIEKFESSNGNGENPLAYSIVPRKTRLRLHNRYGGMNRDVPGRIRNKDAKTLLNLLKFYGL
jgi:hypothetical protein